MKVPFRLHDCCHKIISLIVLISISICNSLFQSLCSFIIIYLQWKLHSTLLYCSIRKNLTRFLPQGQSVCSESFVPLTAWNLFLLHLGTGWIRFGTVTTIVQGYEIGFLGFTQNNLAFHIFFYNHHQIIL